MKNLFFLAAFVAATSASASASEVWFPDMGLMALGQKNAIKTDKSVTDYTGQLGATKIKVVAKKVAEAPIIYVVETDSGCSFDVEVVYSENFFDGIQDVVVIDGTTACD